ncbi:MAG: hypothetical protein PHV60_04290 [bacterium]|nr:hypothetical protein [bacterium]
MFVVKTIGILLFIIVLNKNLFAAEKNKQFMSLAPNGLWWIYGGAGYGRINNRIKGSDTRGWSGLYGVSYNTSKGLFSLRNLHSYHDGDIPSSIDDIGILYGVLGQQNTQAVSLSLGISRISGYYKYDKIVRDFFGLFSYTEFKSRENFTTIGIPIELQAIGTFESFPYVGFGTIVFANWNNKMPFYGVSFNIYFGKMGIREKREDDSDTTLH